MEQTTFTILWQHDSARQLEVHVDADLPAFSPIENRIRSIASIASTHAGLTPCCDRPSRTNGASASSRQPAA
jgi:hypothetical protein